MLEIGMQYEVGITYVPHREFDLWLLDVSRIGLGYRFGEGLVPLGAVEHQNRILEPDDRGIP